MMEVSKTQGNLARRRRIFLQFSNKKHVFYTAKHGEITLQQIWNLPRCWSAHERGLGSYLRNLVLCYFNEHFENKISDIRRD